MEIKRKLGLVFVAILAVSACDTAIDTEPGDEPYGITVDACITNYNDMSYLVVDVMDSLDLNPLPGATVTVGGISLTYSSTSKRYEFSGAIGMVAGDSIDVLVTEGDRSAQGTVTMPERANVIAPTAAGSPYDVSLPIVVQWSAISPAPDKVSIVMSPHIAAGGVYWEQSVDGALVQTDIPANTVLPDSTFNVIVYSINESAVTGDVSGIGSSIVARHLSYSESIQTE